MFKFLIEHDNVVSTILFVVFFLMGFFITKLILDMRKETKEDNDFIKIKKKEWNDYIDQILEENKNDSIITSYIKIHFKKIK